MQDNNNYLPEHGRTLMVSDSLTRRRGQATTFSTCGPEPSPVLFFTRNRKSTALGPQKGALLR
jgi:hypothetical protein